MIKFLAPLIENPNQPYDWGARRTPMHHAVIYGNVEALKVLVTFSENVNVLEENGRNLMQYALQH